MRNRDKYRRCTICRKVLHYTFMKLTGHRYDGSWVNMAHLCRPCANGMAKILADTRAEYR